MGAERRGRVIRGCVCLVNRIVREEPIEDRSDQRQPPVEEVGEEGAHAADALV